MTRETEFFIYLIERYARHKKTTADEILRQWDELGLTNFLYDMYEIYHSESLENAYADIDRLMEEKRSRS